MSFRLSGGLDPVFLSPSPQLWLRLSDETGLKKYLKERTPQSTPKSTPQSTPKSTPKSPFSPSLPVKYLEKFSSNQSVLKILYKVCLLTPMSENREQILISQAMFRNVEKYVKSQK